MRREVDIAVGDDLALSDQTSQRLTDCDDDIDLLAARGPRRNRLRRVPHRRPPLRRQGDAGFVLELPGERAVSRHKAGRADDPKLISFSLSRNEKKCRETVSQALRRGGPSLVAGPGNQLGPGP